MDDEYAREDERDEPSWLVPLLHFYDSRGGSVAMFPSPVVHISHLAYPTRPFAAWQAKPGVEQARLCGYRLEGRRRRWPQVPSLLWGLSHAEQRLTMWGLFDAYVLLLCLADTLAT